MKSAMVGGVLFMAALGGIPASAAPLVTFDFGAGDGSAASASPTAVAAGVTASSLTRGAGFPGEAVYSGGTSGSFNTNSGQSFGTTTDAALAGNRYVQLAVSPTAGNAVSLSALNLFTYSQNRDRTLGVYYSLDNFATAGLLAGTATMNDGFTGTADAIDLSGVTALQNVAGTVTFRLAVAEPQGSFEQRGFGNVAGATNDLVVQGSVSPVPEPGAIMTAGLAAVGWVLRRRRPR